MRLSKELIQHVADAIALHLESKGMAKYAVPRMQIAAKIAEIVTRNMQEEDKLTKDAEKILQAHEAEISRGQLDYRKVLELTKQKLAKDRGFVL